MSHILIRFSCIFSLFQTTLDCQFNYSSPFSYLPHCSIPLHLNQNIENLNLVSPIYPADHFLSAVQMLSIAFRIRNSIDLTKAPSAKVRSET